MPTSATAVVNEPLEFEEQPPRRKRFTREQVSAMLDLGVFAGERFELIDGELFDKMGHNPPHASTIARLNRILSGIYGTERIWSQLPVRVPGEDDTWNEPEPDVAVLKEGQSAEDFETEHPQCSDLVLLVEVADSTVRYDASIKKDLYARAGVTEYWILDLNQRVLHVFRQPVGGAYQKAEIKSSHDTVEIGTAELPVAKLLPSIRT